MAKTNKKNPWKILREIYFSPKTGFTGAQQLHKLSKLPLKTVRNFLKHQRAYGLHAPSRKKFPRLGLTIAAKLYKQTGIDLICWPALTDYNDGHPYILIMMCALSKKAHAIPIKSKDTVHVKKAITQILDEEILPHKIHFLHGDKEGAFISTAMKKYLKAKYNIKIFATGMADTKCFLIERLILTIKRMLSRYMTHHNTYRYIDILPDIIANYNNKIHSTTKLAPNEIKNNGPLTELAYAHMELAQMKRHSKDMRKGRPKPRFKVGDYVRVSFSRNAFSRGYTANYSEKVYIITKVVDKGLLFVYNIKDPYDNIDTSDSNISGTWYSHELIEASKPTEFIIRDILDVKRINGEVYGLTWWLGYDRPSDHTWRVLSKEEIGSLQNTHIELWQKLNKK